MVSQARARVRLKVRRVVVTHLWLVKEARSPVVLTMKRLLLVHTGGTLGMTGRRPQALKPGAFFATLRARVPELFELAELELELFSNLDSCEMQPEAWTALATLLFK